MNNNSFRGGANRYPSPNNNEDGRDRRNPRPEDSRPVERRRSDNEMSGNGRGDRARSRPRSPRREDGTRSNYSRDSFQRADIRQEDRYCRGGLFFRLMPWLMEFATRKAPARWSTSPATATSCHQLDVINGLSENLKK